MLTLVARYVFLVRISVLCWFRNLARFRDYRSTRPVGRLVLGFRADGGQSEKRRNAADTNPIDVVALPFFTKEDTIRGSGKKPPT